MLRQSVRYSSAAAESVFTASRHWHRSLYQKDVKGVTVSEISSSLPKQPEQILLKPSSLALLPPSIYFPPSSVSSEESPAYIKDLIKAPEMLSGCQPLYKITSPTCEYVALRIALLRAGFKRIPNTNRNAQLPANLIWGKSMLTSIPPEGSQKERQYNNMKLKHKFQKFNHFPRGHACLGCKEGLSRILQAKNQVVHSAKFFPKTLFYTSQEDEIFQTILSSPKEKQFIWKPSRGSCGRGILICRGGDEKELLKTIDTIKRFKNNAAKEHGKRSSVAQPLSGVSPVMFQQYVVQDYITNPLLIEGRKFDLRLYVAVTAFQPYVVAYRHKQGFARFAVNSYSNTGVAEKLSHLTNFSVGRRVFMKEAAQGRDASSNDQYGPLSGSGDIVSDNPFLGDTTESLSIDSKYASEKASELKWTLDYLNKILRERKEVVGAKDPSLINVEKMWKGVDDIIRTTLKAARPRIVKEICQTPYPESSCYFELYGFDIMFDDECKPWLIEVNTLPSLESSSLKDYVVKSAVVTDFLNLGLMRPFDRTAEERRLFSHQKFSVLSKEDEMANQFKLPFVPYSRSELLEASADMRRHCYSVSDRTAPTRGETQYTAEALFQHRLMDENRFSGGFMRL
eukprot:Tbor_TRINITY_DN4263_c0_g1::TRINITY_DN4263_c0_g1_i1::g.24010::m.24010